MKKFIATLAIVLVTALVFEVVAQGQSRTQLLTVNEIRGNMEAIYLHDKESGIEVMCIRDPQGESGLNNGVARTVSCFPTGRSWK